MRNASLAFLAFAITLFITSCGSDNPAASNDTFTAPAGSITQTAAAANKTQFIANAKFSTTGTPSGLPTLNRPDEKSAYADCTTVDPTNAPDADGDHIKNQTTTYACTNITDGQGTGTRTGTIKTTDADDNDSKSGYKYEYDVAGSYKYGTTFDGTYKYKGFWEMVKSATTFTYTSNYKGTYHGIEQGVAYDTIGGGNWVFAITPTTMADPYLTGATEYSGFAGYSFTVDGKQTLYVFKMASTGLKYDRGCTNFYTEGSLTYTDGGNNVIKLDWGNSTCSPPTVTFNGTDIT